MKYNVWSFVIDEPKLNRLTARHIILHSYLFGRPKIDDNGQEEDEVNAMRGRRDAKPRPIWLRS
jgi:hypothetical protein